MVTGLKIAKGFVGKREVGSRTAGTVKGGGVVAIGAGVSAGKDAEERDEWKAGGDIVFAYQLLKIELKGWKSRRLEIDEFRHKAAFLGLDEDEEDEDDINDEVTASVATATD